MKNADKGLNIRIGVNVIRGIVEVEQHRLNESGLKVISNC